jgi:hypothetical protein
VNYWAESDLAWELVDAVGPRMANHERAEVYAMIGGGNFYTAIQTLLETTVRVGLAISPALAAGLTHWFAPYTHDEGAPRLRELLHTITLDHG